MEVTAPLVRLLVRVNGAGRKVWRLLDDTAGRCVRSVHPLTAAAARTLSWHWLSGWVQVLGTVRCVRRLAAAWPCAACVVCVRLTESADMTAVWHALPPRVTRLAVRGERTLNSWLAGLRELSYPERRGTRGLERVKFYTFALSHHYRSCCLAQRGRLAECFASQFKRLAEHEHSVCVADCARGTQQ